MPPAKTERSIEITVAELKQKRMTVYVKGESPLIIHRISMDASKQLLLPSRRKNQAEREATAKHDPLREYREAFYLDNSENGLTRLQLRAAAFKGSMMTAALRMPGATKTEIGQLVTVLDDMVPIWGVPEMYMTDVRNSGINKTPDIRTRPIVPQWATKFVVSITVPMVNETAVAKLLGGGGQIAGVGDGRNEKGKLAYGRYQIISAEEFESLIPLLGGRKEQDEAIENPGAWDPFTHELYTWYCEEVKRRELAHTERLAKKAEKEFKGKGKGKRAVKETALGGLEGDGELVGAAAGEENE
jgi:hypothetical protein